MVPNDKPVSLPHIGPADTGEPPVQAHPKGRSFRVEQNMTGATRSDVATQDGVSNFGSIPDLYLDAPEARQYASSNPMPLDAPCTVSAGLPNVPNAP